MNIWQNKFSHKISIFRSFLDNELNIDENEESVDVGWDLYGKYFLYNYNWVVYTLVLVLFLTYSYLSIRTTIYIAEFSMFSQDSQMFWYYFWLILSYTLGFALIY